jgi:hypothetical protein
MKNLSLKNIKTLKVALVEATNTLSSRSAGNPHTTWEHQFLDSRRYSPVNSREPGAPEAPHLNLRIMKYKHNSTRSYCKYFVFRWFK